MSCYRRFYYHPRGRRYTPFNDYQNDNSIKYDNYIEQLQITMMPNKCLDYIENANFGPEFENCICTKTCINMKVKSINEKKVYTKECRKFYGLKILITKAFSTKKYKSQLLEEGKFKVIPFSNNYFKIYLKNYDVYKISYNNEGITIKINNMC